MNLSINVLNQENKQRDSLAVFGFKLVLVLVIINPPNENARSEATLVGILEDWEDWEDCEILELVDRLVL